ncbi:MAG: methylated-DNA--[protein]-cysteine S-methyltransferase [Bacteroidetes bacterium]|nr:MAG: methylated-DNA--[protein]-cysteine S-methyltransferase [Bacteroidota bacterium]
MQLIEITYYHSPVGKLILGSFKDQLCLCDWFHRSKREQIDLRICNGLNAVYEEERSEVVDFAIEELEAYFARELEQFETPLLKVGSEFQQKVWDQLEQIPYGKTVSYLDLAKQMEQEDAIRAVASANGANALSIFVPCHRVIGSSGELTGYAGGLRAKRKLLELESGIQDTQLELFEF